MKKHALSHEDLTSLETTQLEEASGGVTITPSLVNGIPFPGPRGSLGSIDQGGQPWGIVMPPFDTSF